jgi:2-alkyl-3-oxoalkanoate reductase
VTGAATPSPGLSGTPVLVTGATGFIGSRLAERLAEEGARVTGVGRSVDRVSHLSRKGVELIPLDLLDGGALRRVVEGQEVLFHAAVSFSADPAMAEAVNVAATQVLVRRAAEVGVGRFVHVSTVGVYAFPPAGPVPEDTPLALDHPSNYPRTKARSERLVFEAGREAGMEVTAVRPSQVYGPGPGVWTVGMFDRIRQGQPVLLGDGSGHFCPVYLDDVVDALVRAAVSPAAPNEAHNISAEVTDWKTFMGYYAPLAGKEPKGTPLLVARLLAAANRIPGISTPIDRGFIEMATSRHSFPIEKARRDLGWEPKVGLDEGMERTIRWLQQTAAETS